MGNVDKKIKFGKKKIIIISSVLCAAVLCAAAVLLLTAKKNGGDNRTEADASDAPAQTAVQADERDGERTLEDILSRKLPDDMLVTSVTAEKESGEYISSDTGFIISSSEDVDAETIAGRMSMSPDIPFEVKKTGECAYTLKSVSSLPEASVINLLLNGEDGGAEFRWAFQTPGGFRCEGLFPADKSDYVSADTGIEVKFSDIPDAKSAKDYFSIFPETKGSFETHGRTLVFVPAQRLKYDTSYTVIFKAGLPSAEGDVLGEDINIRFRTEKKWDGEYCYASSSRVSETFVKGDIPVVALNCSDGMTKKDFSVKLYRYKNSEDYISALKSYTNDISWEWDDHVFPTEGLECVYDEKQKIMTSQNRDYYYENAYLLLPENLDYGYYLTEISDADGKFSIQRLIQISDISVYSAVLPSEAEFFVNDAGTGETAKGAEITLYSESGSAACTADEKGIANLKINESENGVGVLKIEYGGRVYADLFWYYEREELTSYEKYYMYLYTDREAYLSTDTIRVWGMIRPRGANGAAVPSELALKLAYGYHDGEESAAVPVKVGGDGTFTAEISVENSVENWCYVNLMSGEDVLYSKGIRIEDYVKPIYNVDVQAPVKSFMPQNDPVKLTFSAEYYDGTPAEGLDFDIGGYYVQHAEPASVRTDKNGRGSSEALLKDENTWRPRTAYIDVDLSGVENEYEGSYYSVKTICLYRDVMLEYEEDGGKLSVTTSKADFSKLPDDFDFYYGPEPIEDIIRGEAVDTEISATLYRTWHTKTEWGSYYDFLLKKNVKQYKYESHTETVGTYTVKTSGGKGVFNFPVDDKESRYYAELSWKDSFGQRVEDMVYFGDYSYYDSDPIHNYTLSSDGSFKENETVEFKLFDNYRQAEDSKGRIFYTFVNTGFAAADAVEGTSFSRVMTNEFIPNVYISGAYFDGRHVFPINESEYSSIENGMTFDPEDRELFMNISSDKERYSPADPAEIAVDVKDKDGKAVSGAAVSLSLVDEAAFAIADQDACPLDRIYSYVYYTPATAYYSYVQHSLGPINAAEKGGGGGEGPSVRKDFVDTAAFMTGVTDDTGKASFSVKLPDNITSWRATVQAVGSDERGEIYAGAETKLLPSSLTFFLTPVILDKYTEGDDVCLSAKAAGAENGVDISIKVSGSGTDETITVREGGAANFGKLAAGEYKALFSAEYGDEGDAVELPFEVVETQLEASASRTFELNTESIDIDPLRWPVRLNFYDKEYLFYGEVLDKLLSDMTGRTDFEIAGAFALKEYGYLTEEEYIKRRGGISGMMRIMPYAEEDAELTARICAAAPELISGNGTAEALYAVIDSEDSSPEEITSAYMGLAGLSEPVLLQVKELIEGSGITENTDKLRLCAAAALLGDYEYAYEYYTKITSDSFKAAAKADGSVEAYVGTVDETRLALITASALGLPEADAFAEYLVRNKQREVSVSAELMFYLKHYKPKRDGSAVLKYKIGGEEKTVTLDRFGACSLSFGKEQFENAEFEVVSGSVLCTACYEGRITERNKEPSLKVEKTYTSVSGGWNPGALIKVTVKVPYTDSYITVDDVIPSCARFAGGSELGYVSRSGQRISGSVSRKTTLVYYIRLVSPGEYVAESAAADDHGSGEWGMSKRSVITVEEYERNV